MCQSDGTATRSRTPKRIGTLSFARTVRVATADDATASQTGSSASCRHPSGAVRDEPRQAQLTLIPRAIAITAATQKRHASTASRRAGTQPPPRITMVTAVITSSEPSAGATTEGSGTPSAVRVRLIGVGSTIFEIPDERKITAVVI